MKKQYVQLGNKEFRRLIKASKKCSAYAKFDPQKIEKELMSKVRSQFDDIKTDDLQLLYGLYVVGSKEFDDFVTKLLKETESESLDVSIACCRFYEELTIGNYSNLMNIIGFILEKHGYLKDHSITFDDGFYHSMCAGGWFRVNKPEVNKTITLLGVIIEAMKVNPNCKFEGIIG